MSRTTLPAKQLNSKDSKNIIINGNMAMDIRNLGASHTIVAASGWQYVGVDRMRVYCAGANLTGQRVAGADPLQYLYQITGAASASGVAFGQAIAAYNIAPYIGKVVTLSILISGSALTSFDWYLAYPGAADDLTSPTTISTGTLVISSTLTRFTVTFTVPANCDKGLFIYFYKSVAFTSGTLKFGEFQLEEGSSFTAFEKVPYEVEITRCEHYARWGPLDLQFYAVGASYTHEHSFSFPRMRVTPTVGANVADPNLAQTLVNVTNAGLIRATPYNAAAYATSTNAGQAYCLGYRAFFSAEIN